MNVTTEDGCNEIFLDNVSTIIINSLEISLTVYLLNEIKKRKISLIIGDEKKNPSLQVLPLYGTFETTSHFYDQINYTEYDKNKCWFHILSDKLTMEKKLLNFLGLNDGNIFDSYINNIESPDENNIEGTLAKVYFRLLFGKNYNRRDSININFALNYGYAILLSYINNVIVSYGYKTELGVNHKSKTNEFNLSCDFIEPFRSFIDKTVYEVGNFDLTKEYKLKLVNILYEKCIYNDKEMELRNAIKIYIKERLDSMRSGYYKESVIEYV